jgi:hypothetical protein
MYEQEIEEIDKKIATAKKEVVEKQGKVRDLLKKKGELVDAQTLRVVKKRHLAPGELDRILEENFKENEKLLGRRIEKNGEKEI